jgi:hypothetical protein
MAYNVKDVFFLDSFIKTTTGAGDGCAILDVSSYVQSVTRGAKKGVGLAIYKVHWDVYQSATNHAMAPATTGVFRAMLASDLGIAAQAVGGTAFALNEFTVKNDLAVSVMDWMGGGTAAGDPAPKTWLEPSTDVPYVIVRDSIFLGVSISTAVSVAATIAVRLECAQITLDMATLNQLLRTQTV